MENKEFFEKEFMPKMNKIGIVTNVLGVLFSFLPVLVLGIVYSVWPTGSALATAFVTGASSFGVLWFIEPISYFPTLGPIGTYMAFLSGNISNMRIPCASMAQVSAEVEPGTEKGSVIATIGMSVSIIINIVVLTVGVVAGALIINALPANVVSALNYLLPALFGALFVQFGINHKKHSIILLLFAILIYILINVGAFAWLPGAANYLPMLSCVLVSILYGLAVYKKEKKAEA